ncbi:MAG: glycosyltransferase, partial [Actinomycetota bacterium]
MSGRSILFLDQTGALGGGEFALRDVVQPHRANSRVVLFADGPFRELLEADGVAVTVLEPGGATGRALAIRRESGPLSALTTGPALLSLARQVADLARDHDLLYANSQKASLVGAAASRLSGVPLVIHLHDLLIPDHFRALHRRLSVAAANRARRVIADSAATATAFVAAGGRADRVDVVHYGFPTPPLP